MAIWDRKKGGPELIPMAKFGLARALLAGRVSHRRAVDLAHEAYAAYSKVPGTGEEQREVQRWLAARRGE